MAVYADKNIGFLLERITRKDKCDDGDNPNKNANTHIENKVFVKQLRSRREGGGWYYRENQFLYEKHPSKNLQISISLVKCDN